jgi:hypothetical protein
MAHWLLRGRIAEHNDDGRVPQEQLEEDQHRPSRNERYQEVARERGSERVSESEGRNPSG